MQAKHIPYRDSKLTRILQESLGGNSRTTLIINCSPSAYNEPETLSTLRFGIRAKSIKNNAKVNAELSPLELKALLNKSSATNATLQRYIEALEKEVAIWRNGGTVDRSEWAVNGKAAPAAPAAAPKTAASPPSVTPSASSRSMTPVNPLIDSLRGEDGPVSRPQTPLISLDKDERDEFLRRENELSDALAEREGILNSAEKLVKELKEELAFLKDQEKSSSEVRSSLFHRCTIFS